MRTLILMRHADAVDTADSDHARSLSVQGELAAEHQADYFAHAKWPKPTAILASSALRTLTTANIVADAIGLSVQAKPELYQADAKGYLALIHQLPNDINCALIVGHNTGISDAVSLLAGTPPRYLTPAGLAILQVPSEFGWHALPGFFALKEWL